MKMMIGLLGIAAALFFTGCIIREREVRVRSAPPPVIVVEGVPYDDPGRGWYIDGYYAPGHVRIAPFWTFDIGIVHSHFDHYRGHYRGHFEKHFKQHPERFGNRGRDDRRDDRRGR